MPKLELPIDLGDLLGTPFQLGTETTPYDTLNPDHSNNRDPFSDSTIVPLRRLWETLATTIPCVDRLHQPYPYIKSISRHDPAAGITSLLEINGTQYTVRDFLGAGSFGAVTICLDSTTNQPVIMKKIEIDGGDNYYVDIATALTEILTQVIVNRSEPSYTPAILKLGIWERNIYIIMEYRPGCDLQKFYESRMSDNERQDTCQQALISLANISKVLYGWYEFIHGDMKFDNLLRTNDGQIILIDFGFANMFFGSPEEPSTISNALIARRDVANKRQPTRDLAMLMISAKYRSRGTNPVINRWLDNLLLPGQCDVSTPELRGGITAHPPHGLRSYRGIDWGSIYKYSCFHNNIQATPDKVIQYFAVAPDVAPPPSDPPVAPAVAPPVAPPVAHPPSEPSVSPPTSFPANIPENTVVGGRRKTKLRYKSSRRNKKDKKLTIKRNRKKRSIKKNERPVTSRTVRRRR